MGRGTWKATVHGVAKSQTRLKGLSTHTDKHTCVSPLEKFYERGILHHQRLWFFQIGFSYSLGIKRQTILHCQIKEFLFLNFFTGAWLIYNVVLASGIQQSESVTHTHISPLTEQSSLCCPAGPRQLSIVHIVVYVCQFQSPSLSVIPPLTLVTSSLFSTSVTLVLFCK